MKRLYLLLFSFLFLSSCFQSESSKGGYIYPFGTSFSQPSGTTSVTIKQRSDLSINIPADDYVLDESTGFYNAPFNFSDLILDKSYIFEVSGNYQPTISFPLFIKPKPFVLGGLDSTLFDTISNAVSEPPYSITIQNEGVGIVMGAPNPLSLNQTICGPPIESIAIVEKDTGEQIIGNIKSFFFSDTGAVGSSYTPDFDNFIFFNVPEGNYNIRYRTIDASAVYTQEVVVIAAHISFGYQLPCQEFDEFIDYLR